MTRHRRLETARAWFWFVLAGTLVGGLVGFIAGTVVPPTYAGHATILVSPVPRDAGVTSGDIEVTRAAAATLSELATTGPVLDRVIRSTSSSTDVINLQKVVSTRVPVGTSLIDITVTSKSAGEAAALANALAGELVAYPSATSGNAGSGWQVVAAVVDPAVPPRTAEGFGIVLTTVLAAAFAMVLSICLVLLIENLRDREPDL